MSARRLTDAAILVQPGERQLVGLSFSQLFKQGKAMTVNQIFLDLDGVVANFFGAALRVHDRLDLVDKWPKGEWDMAKVMGISEGNFWNGFDYPEFWRTIPVYSWAEFLIGQLQKFAPITVATSPGLSCYAATSKIEWVRESLPVIGGPGFSDFLIGHQKHLLAKPGAVLIDDNETNCRRFKAAGGEAILFPQVWNCGFVPEFIDEECEHPKAWIVLNRLQQMAGSI